jgi:hypothetical protein
MQSCAFSVDQIVWYCRCKRNGGSSDIASFNLSVPDHEISSAYMTKYAG